MITGLFPDGVVTVTGSPTLAVRLLPEEEACVRRAVPRRRSEFAAGRACAREALRQLGITGFPLVAGVDRAPIWPTGVIGSLTHCEGLCGVAVARQGAIRSLGLDAEAAAALPEDLVHRVCTAAEIRWARTAAAPTGGDWFTLMFSAKESVYKCWYPIMRRNLDFPDVQLTIDAPSMSFTVTFAAQQGRDLPKGMTLAGRFAVTRGHVLTAAIMTLSSRT
jgi:4'-phosphopantetheinyl transferase EntD